MYDHVLLPTDGDDTTDATIEHMTTFAEVHSTAVHVLSVVDSRDRSESPSTGIASDMWERSKLDRVESTADVAIKAFPEGIEIECIIVKSMLHSTIVDYAADSGIDFIVTVIHGRTDLDHYPVGPVAEHAVRQSDVPMLTVRAADEE